MKNWLSGFTDKYEKGIATSGQQIEVKGGINPQASPKIDSLGFIGVEEILDL